MKVTGGLVRTATCRITRATDQAGTRLDLATTTEQVGWLGNLVAEVGQAVLDQHWNRIGIETVSAEFKPDGARVNSHAYKAVSDAWGWGSLPAGVSGSSRVKWMGLELAGRQLRSAAYRLEVVDLLLAGADPEQCPDLVTGRSTRRQIGKYKDTAGKLPLDLFDLEPDTPRLPAQVVLAASDYQFAQLVIAPDQTSVTIKVLLPAVPRPGKGDWTPVELTATLPERYRVGKLLAPTLRVEGGQIRLDVPVQVDPVPMLTDTGRTLGLDWGSNRMLTGAVASRVSFPATSSLAQVDLRTLVPAVDGHPLLFDPSGLLKKARLLGEEREKVNRKLDHWGRLLQRPDPDLEAKRVVLVREVEAVTGRQRHLLTATARLAARWAVTQALTAGCSTIALEDLKSLEHRDRGRRNNVRISLAMRGQVHTAIEEAAALAGIYVVTVPAGGTSRYCPRCDGRLQHRTCPNGPVGPVWAQWASCPSCKYSADRDHSAAEKVAQRGLARKVRKVRHQRTRRAELVQPVRTKGSSTTRKKGVPTPRQPSPSARGKGRCASRTVTPPPASLVHRWVGPVPQGTSSSPAGNQVRNKVLVSTDLGGLLQTHRRRLKATPVLYRRSLRS